MDLLALPDKVLAVVAAQLPPSMRHGSFGLLCTRLKAAADLAAGSQPDFSFAAPVQVHKRRSDGYDSFHDQEPEDDIEELALADHRRLKLCKTFAGWLLKHGRHLTKLQLTNFNTALDDLPPGLRELELHGCSARWHAGGSWHTEHTLSLHGLTSLTRLCSCCCSCTHETLAQIAAAASLQHLEVIVCPSDPCEPTDCHRGTGCEALPSYTFRQLTNLTCLKLNCVSQGTHRVLLNIDGTGAGGYFDHYPPYPAPNAAQHLSCLVKLQTLIIHTGDMSAQLEAGLEGLRCLPGLSRLELSFTHMAGGIRHWDGSMRSRSSWLQGLSALQVLTLDRMYIDPNQLHNLTQLKVLRLNKIAFSPTRLLGLLAHLTCLQRLDVAAVWPPHSRVALPWLAYEPPLLEAGADVDAAEGAAADWASACWPPASPAYASLTASSQLQQLALVNCVLPAGAWQHAFPPGRQLTALQSLQACCYEWDGRITSCAPLSGADLVCIAGACPNMQHLCVW